MSNLTVKLFLIVSFIFFVTACIIGASDQYKFLLPFMVLVYVLIAVLSIDTKTSAKAKGIGYRKNIYRRY